MLHKDKFCSREVSGSGHPCSWQCDACASEDAIIELAVAVIAFILASALFVFNA